MITIKTYLERIRDPRQLLGDGLVCGRRRLVVVLVGEPPEEGGHLVVVEVGEVDLVGGADLAQPLEHGARRSQEVAGGRRRSHPDWGQVLCCLLSLQLAPGDRLVAGRGVTASHGHCRCHVTTTQQRHVLSAQYLVNTILSSSSLSEYSETRILRINQKLTINIHQMESISTNVLIMNYVYCV